MSTVAMPTIDLATPVRAERVPTRPPRTVYVYRCPSCGQETRVRGPVPRGGWIVCLNCAPTENN